MRALAREFGDGNLSLEFLTKMKKMHSFFSDEVKEEFDDFMNGGRMLFFGTTDQDEIDSMMEDRHA